MHHVNNAFAFQCSRPGVFNSRPGERWGAGVEYHFQEINEPYAPS